MLTTFFLSTIIAVMILGSLFPPVVLDNDEYNWNGDRVSNTDVF